MIPILITLGWWNFILLISYCYTFLIVKPEPIHFGLVPVCWNVDPKAIPGWMHADSSRLTGSRFIYFRLVSWKYKLSKAIDVDHRNRDLNYLKLSNILATAFYRIRMGLGEVISTRYGTGARDLFRRLRVTMAYVSLYIYRSLQLKSPAHRNKERKFDKLPATISSLVGSKLHGRTFDARKPNSTRQAKLAVLFICYLGFQRMFGCNWNFLFKWSILNVRFIQDSNCLKFETYLLFFC